MRYTVARNFSRDFFVTTALLLHLPYSLTLMVHKLIKRLHL